MAWIPLVLALISGWLLVRLIGPARGLQPRWAVALLDAALGLGLGAALSSVAYFLMLLTGIASVAAILALHVAVAAALSWLAWRKRGQLSVGEPRSPATRPGRETWVLALLVVIVLIPLLVAQARISSSNPHGLWDAWAIWNIRAKFLAGPGDAWHHAVSPLLHRTHPDYPLLLSGLVAVNWRAAGGEMDPAIPGAITYLFPIAAAGVLLAALTLLRGVNLGLLAILVLLSDKEFLTHISGQMSDVPLAFFYLGTIVCFLMSLETKGKPAVVLMLAGVLASAAAWTKDEGIVFAVVVLGCAAAFEWWNGRFAGLWRRFPWFVAGALPGLLLVGYFKFFLTPHANPMTTQAPAKAAVKFVATGRWTNLLLGIWENLGERGNGWAQPMLVLGLVVAALGFYVEPRRRKPVVFVAVTIAGLFAAYCTAILANPSLLRTPFVTPLDRMFSQLWPSVVLLWLSVLRPWETPASAVAAPALDGKKKRGASRR